MWPALKFLAILELSPLAAHTASSASFFRSFVLSCTALESMGNALRIMLGRSDEDLNDDLEEAKEEESVDEEEGGSCGSDRPITLTLTRSTA